jgi:hypothetical protein
MTATLNTTRPEPSLHSGSVTQMGIVALILPLIQNIKTNTQLKEEFMISRGTWSLNFACRDS